MIEEMLTTTNIPSASSSTYPWDKPYEEGYQHLAPLQVALAIFILTQNSIILADYYKDRKRMVTAIFMMIAGADIVSAVVELVKDAVVLACIKDSKISIVPWVIRAYLSVGRYGYVCSVFYNVVLSVVKTVNIVDPYLRLNKKLIAASLVLVSLFWFAIDVADNVYAHKYADYGSNGSCTDQWLIVEEYSQIGNYLIEKTFYLPTFIEFLLPSLILLICMPIQMVYIRRTLQTRSDNPQISTATHVNITVVMVSMLFVVCNGSFACFELLCNYVNGVCDRVYGTDVPWILVQYTLPLLNAALFPLILILRKPSLSQKYKQYLLIILLFPSRVWGRVRQRQGYEMLPGQ